MEGKAKFMKKEKFAVKVHVELDVDDSDGYMMLKTKLSVLFKSK